MNNQCSCKLEQKKQAWLKIYTMALMQHMILCMHLQSILEKEWQKQQMLKKMKKFKKRIHQYRKRLAKKRHARELHADTTFRLQQFGLFSNVSDVQTSLSLNMNYTY